MTNNDDDNASNAPPALEHETSQATEALELIGAHDTNADSKSDSGAGLGIFEGES